MNYLIFIVIFISTSYTVNAFKCFTCNSKPEEDDTRPCVDTEEECPVGIKACSSVIFKDVFNRIHYRKFCTAPGTPLYQYMIQFPGSSICQNIEAPTDVQRLPTTLSRNADQSSPAAPTLRNTVAGVDNFVPPHISNLSKNPPNDPSSANRTVLAPFNPINPKFNKPGNPGLRNKREEHADAPSDRPHAPSPEPPKPQVPTSVEEAQAPGLRPLAPSVEVLQSSAGIAPPGRLQEPLPPAAQEHVGQPPSVAPNAPAPFVSTALCICTKERCNVGSFDTMMSTVLLQNIKSSILKQSKLDANILRL